MNSLGMCGTTHASAASQSLAFYTYNIQDILLSLSESACSRAGHPRLHQELQSGGAWIWLRLVKGRIPTTKCLPAPMFWKDSANCSNSASCDVQTLSLQAPFSMYEWNDVARLLGPWLGQVTSFEQRPLWVQRASEYTSYHSYVRASTEEQKGRSVIE